MAIWTVHAPPTVGSTAEWADKLIFLRDGFSVSAFVFAPLWALRYRLWFAFAIWLVVTLAISIVDVQVGKTVAAVLSLPFGLWFAFQARDFRRAKLEARGWQLVGLVDARTLDEAEVRFFVKTANAPGTDAADADTDAGLPSRTPRVLLDGAYPPVVGFMGASRI